MSRSPQQRGTNSNSISSPKPPSRATLQWPGSMVGPHPTSHGMPRSMSDLNPADIQFPAFDNMEWPDTLFQEAALYSMDMDLDASFQHQELPTADGYFDLQQANINMNNQHSYSAIYPSYNSLGSLPSVPSSTDFTFNQSGNNTFFPTLLSSMLTTPMVAPTEQKEPGDTFSTLLGHINRLQRCLEKVRSGHLFSHPHTRNNQLQIVISTIDSSCMVTCNALKEQFQVILNQCSEAKMNGTDPDTRDDEAIRPDQPLIGLAITAIITIPRLCQALMRSELPNVQSSLDNMLLLNRLGCNILQTRIALVNIKKLDRGLAYLTEDAKREISMVHTEFENMKKGWRKTPSD